jgi:hypothetical protein
MVTVPFLFQVTGKGREERGVRINLIANKNEDDEGNTCPAKGVWIGGFNYSSDFKGVELGVVNACSEGGSLTGVAVGAINYATEDISGFALQIGAVNYVKEYSGKGTIVQIGLYNRAGDQSIPVLNIRRAKRLEDVVSKSRRA